MSVPHILLIVGGGIAAYKSCELVRLIRKGGGEVACVLTDGGSKFVTPLALAALSENPVHTTLWDLKNEVEMGHIQLSRAADLVVVCPATADLLAHMAAGIADDLATTLLLATDKPVLAVPAMNVKMWQHAATVRNVQDLRTAGVTVMEPDEGTMACGEFGPGRLPEPERVWREIARMLGIPLPEVEEFAEAEGDYDSGLGGLSASMILRSTLPPEDGTEGFGDTDGFGDEDDSWLAAFQPAPDPDDFTPLPLLGEDGTMPGESPAPTSPLLVKKGKARAAPATDPEAINHLVSPRMDIPPPEVFVPGASMQDTFSAEPSSKTAASAPPSAPTADPLAGQPDFETEPQHRPLFGKHILVTAGPTHEPIDPVRYIANRSSGRQGFAIAAAAARLGARVTLVAGPVHLETPTGVDRIDVETARQMDAAVKRLLPADCAIMVAAVADWRTRDVAPEKLKKRGSAPPVLVMEENPDILTGVAAHKLRPRLLIGFAAETQRVLEHAAEKRKRKGADWIVANDVSGPPGASVMGGTHNLVHIVTSQGIDTLPELPKDDVAQALVERIANALGQFEN